MYAVDVTSPAQLPLVSGCRNSGGEEIGQGGEEIGQGGEEIGQGRNRG